MKEFPEFKSFTRFDSLGPIENELLKLAQLGDEIGLRSSSGSKLRWADAIRPGELNPLGGRRGSKFGEIFLLSNPLTMVYFIQT